MGGRRALQGLHGREGRVVSIMLYGHLHDYGSFSNITRAVTRELRRHRCDAQVYPVGDRAATAIGQCVPVGFDAAARVGICVGYPEAAAAWLQGHAVRVLMTVCETNRIPESWVTACNTATLVVVPSTWSQAAFIASGVRVPVEVVPHGVWPVYDDLVGTPPEALTFLHVSGALSFAERKGTAPLLRAFRSFVDERPDAKLLLKIPGTRGLAHALALVGLTRHVEVLPSETLPPRRMAELLASVHAVVQPSRAEGFGLVPLEARCAGTPVVITHCTGHSEHAERDDVIVAHGGLAPLETQANPVGEAPTVSVAAVKASLDECASYLYTRKRVSAEKARSDGYVHWSWERVLAPFICEIKKQDERRHIRLGGSAGLRGTS
jgi:glycosyltransferase involved in cell wall biosynthesis